MPPKKKEPPGANKKTQDKAKAKVVEDKTFGLKNKKGKKQQTYIKNVAHQVQGQVKKSEAEAKPKLSKKELEKQKLEELNDLFKPVQKQQVVPAGVDPKSVLCNYFKQGTCQKGFKCKFSHDLSIERKSEKRNIYEDTREKEEGMGDWDQETLEDAINKKHGSTNSNKTEIICKFFLDALEKSLYGWFWNCPNGTKCMYRHALPPGFVLKKDQKKEDEADKVSLEEHIENERNQLSGALTPVNKETFLAWKKRKIAEKKQKLQDDMKLKKEEFKAGKGMMKISGKEVFLFKPEMADADDDEADDDVYKREVIDGEDDEPCTEIDIDVFANELQDAKADNSKVTKFSTLLPKDRETAIRSGWEQTSTDIPDADPTEETDVNGVAAACASDPPAASADVVIDESLFEDLDEDLDDLDLDDGDD